MRALPHWEELLAQPCLSPVPGLALAFHDGSVHIVHRLSLQMMAVFYGSSSQRPVDEPALKRPRTAGPLVHFKAMQLSWTSLALAGVDSHGKVGALLWWGYFSPRLSEGCSENTGSSSCEVYVGKGCIPLVQKLSLVQD